MTSQVLFVKIATIVFLTTALSANAADRPDWVSGESLEWPRYKYILGTGIADDLVTARNRARADLARFFNTRIVANTTSHLSETSVSENGHSSTSTKIAASDSTRLSTDKVLHGVEIADSWQDPVTRQVFALAVLDRKAAAGRLHSQLDEMNTFVRIAETRITSSSDTVERALAAFNAINYVRRIEPLIADLRVVEPAAKVDTTQYSRLFAVADKIFSSLIITTSVSGQESAIITEGITQGLAESGLHAAPNVASAHLSLEAISSIDDLGARDGWFWSRASVTLVMREIRTSKTLLQFTETARESSTLALEANRRAARSVAFRIAKTLPSKLFIAVSR